MVHGPGFNYYYFDQAVDLFRRPCLCPFLGHHDRLRPIAVRPYKLGDDPSLEQDNRRRGAAEDRLEDECNHYPDGVKSAAKP